VDDNKGALAETRVLGDDSVAIKHLVDKLRRQEQLARAFIAAFLRNREKAVIAYREHPKAAESDAETAHALADLAEVHVSEDFEDVLKKRYAAEDDVTGVDVFTRFALGASERRRLDELLPRRPFVLQRQIPAAVTPEQIVHAVRIWDWWLAGVVFLLTILAFFATLYDSDFGSWTDYAKAAGAGVGSQAVGAAVWSLFPSLRSYRLPPPKTS
jgi:hypothetical protein